MYVDDDSDDQINVNNKPHIEYQDNLYDAKIALDTAIFATEMYSGHDTKLLETLRTTLDVLEARIIDE